MPAPLRSIEVRDDDGLPVSLALDERGVVALRVGTRRADFSILATADDPAVLGVDDVASARVGLARLHAALGELLALDTLPEASA